MNRLRPVLSLMLAVLVLCASTSFIVGVHHCGGHIASVAMFTEAEPCPMEQQAPPCHKPTKSSCCSDERIVHESEDFKPASTTLHVAITPLIAELASPVVVALLIPEVPTAQLLPDASPPPLPSPDYQVVLSQFLI